MIASVSGTVQVVGLTSAVIEVGGVGLELQCSPATLAGLRTGEHASLASSLVVREESLTLFGFSGRDEKAVFELVQTASGVGPKLAQAMLAVLGPDEVRRAIAGEDHKTLTRVPGIGAKGAQRIVLELRDKMAAPVATQPGQPAPVAQAPWRAQVVEALTGLGWSAKESEKAADAVAPAPGAPAEVAVLLRAALQSLSRA